MSIHHLKFVLCPMEQLCFQASLGLDHKVVEAAWTALQGDINYPPSVLWMHCNLNRYSGMDREQKYTDKKVEPKQLHPWNRFMACNSAATVALFKDIHGCYGIESGKIGMGGICRFLDNGRRYTWLFSGFMYSRYP